MNKHFSHALQKVKRTSYSYLQKHLLFKYFNFNFRICTGSIKCFFIQS